MKTSRLWPIQILVTLLFVAGSVRAPLATAQSTTASASGSSAIQAAVQQEITLLGSKGYFRNNCGANGASGEPWEIPLPCNDNWNASNILLRSCADFAPTLKTNLRAAMQLYIHGLDGRTGGYYQGQIVSLASPPSATQTFGGPACDLIGAGEGSKPGGENMHGQACGPGCKVTTVRSGDTVIDAYVDLTTCQREQSWVSGAWIRNLSSKWLVATEYYLQTAVEGTNDKMRGMPIPNYAKMNRGWACAPIVLDYLSDFQQMYETPLIQRGVVPTDCVPGAPSNNAQAACHAQAAQKTLEGIFALVTTCFEFEAAMDDQIYYLLESVPSRGPLWVNILMNPPIYCSDTAPCATSVQNRYDTSIVNIMQQIQNGNPAWPQYQPPGANPYFFPWSDSSIAGVNAQDLPIRPKE